MISLVFIVYYWIKWRIKAWGWIPIIFFVIFGTFHMLAKYGPLDPSFITKTFLKIKKLRNAFEIYMISDVPNFWISIFGTLWKKQAMEKDEDPSKQSWKSCIWGQYLPENMKWKCGNNTKKLRNRETKKLRSQEAKKPRN